MTQEKNMRELMTDIHAALAYASMLLLHPRRVVSDADLASAAYGRALRWVTMVGGQVLVRCGDQWCTADVISCDSVSVGVSTSRGLKEYSWAEVMPTWRHADHIYPDLYSHIKGLPNQD